MTLFHFQSMGKYSITKLEQANRMSSCVEEKISEFSCFLIESYSRWLLVCHAKISVISMS